jgi:16S rRNA (cytosine1402-N4)-methyltransferase
VPPGVVVDTTVGGAGHAAAILESRPDLALLGLDRDPEAVEAARTRLARFGSRAQVVMARFDAFGDAARAASGGDGPLGGPVVGVLFDLGVSSHQIDRAERGFSYRQEGPLDMRMDPTSGMTAAEVVNGYPVPELARLFRANGETRWADRIARAVAAARPLTTTTGLADVVAGSVPAAHRRRGHPAARVFQALRIEVNSELDVLDRALDEIPDRLVPGGRAVVLSYHSGEDRLVKEKFRQWSGGACICPPGLPCVCGAPRFARLVARGGRKADPSDAATNRRATAARLRAVEITEEHP